MSIDTNDTLLIFLTQQLEDVNKSQRPNLLPCRAWATR
jgi:hypothetical protein